MGCPLGPAEPRTGVGGAPHGIGGTAHGIGGATHGVGGAVRPSDAQGLGPGFEPHFECAFDRRRRMSADAVGVVGFRTRRFRMLAAFC